MYKTFVNVYKLFKESRFLFEFRAKYICQEIIWNTRHEFRLRILMPDDSIISVVKPPHDKYYCNLDTENQLLISSWLEKVNNNKF